MEIPKLYKKKNFVLGICLFCRYYYIMTAAADTTILIDSLAVTVVLVR